MRSGILGRCGNKRNFAGYSNSNRNTGGRSLQDYENGATWIMEELATAMEDYGEVGSLSDFRTILTFPPLYFLLLQAKHSRKKRQLSSGLNRIYLGLTVMIVMMQLMNRKCERGRDCSLSGNDLEIIFIL